MIKTLTVKQQIARATKIQNKAYRAGVALAIAHALRKNKYNNVKTELDGYVFDSNAEALYYSEQIRLRYRAGEIEKLNVHQRFTIIPKSSFGREICYEADFSYFDVKLAKYIVVDVKGVRTALYRLKRRLFIEKYPNVEFIEVDA